ncbi:MAG: hypothetical protein ABIG61_07520 [Planctomycetota bacterium]
MFATDCSHCQVVNDSLSGQGTIGEQTFASIAILRDRLERLKRRDSMFAAIEFSEEVGELCKHQKEVGIN